MNAIKNEVTVVNTLTGEVLEFKYENVQQLKDQFIELDALKAAIERAHKKMKNDLEFALGTDEEVQFSDGYRLKRFYRTSYTYRKEVVGKYLDWAQMDLVTQINGTALKTLVKDMNQRGDLPAGAWDEIEASADRVNSEYVRLLKGNA